VPRRRRSTPRDSRTFKPVLFSIILVSLANIQSHLEDPFDLIGDDDITINAEKFVERLDA
jgi:hypothetical protein